MSIKTLTVCITEDERERALELWWANSTLGHDLFEKKRYAASEIKFIEALKIAERLAGVVSDKEEASVVPFGVMTGEGQAESAIKTSDDVLVPNSAETMVVRERAVTLEDQERLGKALNNLAALYYLQGKYQMAEEMYERCLDLKLALYGEEHLETALVMHNLAALHCAKKRWEKAEILYKRSLEIRQKFVGTTNKELIPILKNYAIMLRKILREAEAEQLESRIATIEAASGESQSQLATC
jgi:hypothetical protein